MDVRRQKYLQLMQIPAWQRRPSTAMAASAVRDALSVHVSLASALELAVHNDLVAERSVSTLSIRGSRRDHAVPVPATGRAPRPAATAEVVVDDPAARTGAASSDSVVALMEWPMLVQTVRSCERCELHRTRKQTVFGSGSTSAKLLFIGEAPGQREDATGEPFVGAAGQLFSAMLEAIGMRREDAYIANILKCRPPRNRESNAAGVSQCTPFLTRQIELLQPSLLVALGRTSAQTLLESKSSLARLRGQTHRYGASALPLLVTYHPADLLRSSLDKRRSFEDLQLIRKTLRELGA